MKRLLCLMFFCAISLYANESNFVMSVYKELVSKSQYKSKASNLETEIIRILDNKKDELKKQDEMSIAKGLKAQMDSTKHLKTCSTMGTEMILAKLPQYSDGKLYEVYKKATLSGKLNGTKEQEIFLNHFWTVSNQWAENACKNGTSRSSIDQMLKMVMPYVREDLQKR